MINKPTFVHGAELAKMQLACLLLCALLAPPAVAEPPSSTWAPPAVAEPLSSTWAPPSSTPEPPEGYLTEGNLTETETAALMTILARTSAGVAGLAAEKLCPRLKKCQEKTCKMPKDLNLISLIKNIETGGLDLLCRSHSNLTIGWPTNQDETYIMEIVDSTGENVSQILTQNPHTFDQLDYNKAYYVCLFIFNSCTQMAKSLKCEKFWTLSKTHIPQVVPSIESDTWSYNKSVGFELSIKWEPAKDRVCIYELAVWEDQVFFMQKESEVPKDRYNATLLDLQFNKNYTVKILAKGHEYRESNSSWFFFQSPSCLEFHENPEICFPPAPINVNVTEELSHKKVSSQNGDVAYYDVKVHWKKPEYLPDFYQINLTNTGPLTAVSVKTVYGNQTEVIFEAVDIVTSYQVSIMAISKGGVSDTTVVIREKKQNTTDLRYDPHSNLLWALLVPILSFIAIAGMSAFIYHRHEKLKLYKRRCRYFEDLEQKAPKEADNGSSFIIHAENDPFEVIPDKLRLYEILGEGAFGVVRKGWLPDQKREVAVKMLKDEPSAEEVKQFRQEIDMMKAVGSHPHIVSLVGCCTKPTATMLLVVEFCPCGDLQNYLRAVWDKMASKSSQKTFTPSDFDFVQSNNEDKSCPHINYAELCPIENNEDSNHVNLQQTNFIVNKLYDLEQTIKEEQNSKCDLTSVDLLSFARQIAMGMEFLSLNRVVHRDLAARNVLVCSDKTVKIADFGLSRDIYQENMYKKTGTGKLPIKWMAIESLTRQLYTTQSDVWSYGILLWEIVTLGGNPYPSVPSGRLLKMLMSGYRMECPSNCSQELYSLMMSCWQTRPKDRPTFCEIRQRIDSLLDEMCSHAYLTLDMMEAKQSYDNAKHIIDQFSKNNGFNLGILEKKSPESERYVRPISFTKNKIENHI